MAAFISCTISEREFCGYHKQNIYSPTSTKSLCNFGLGNSGAAKAARQKTEELCLEVHHAEAQFVQFVQFVAEHNLPSHTGDQFTKLVKSMFPD